MVTAPSPDVVSEAQHFIETLREHRLRFDGVIFNRTLGYLRDQPADAGEMPPSRELDEALAVLDSIQAREQRVIERIKKQDIGLCARVPELARDIHSIEDLFHVAMALG
jgi:hypothetical protein